MASSEKTRCTKGKKVKNPNRKKKVALGVVFLDEDTFDEQDHESAIKLDYQKKNVKKRKFPF